MVIHGYEYIIFLGHMAYVDEIYKYTEVAIIHDNEVYIDSDTFSNGSSQQKTVDLNFPILHTRIFLQTTGRDTQHMEEAFHSGLYEDNLDIY